MVQRLSPRRRAAALSLAIAVIAIHACVVEHLADRMTEFDAHVAMPARIEVVYVREMDISEPPKAVPRAPPPAPPKKRRVAPPAAPRPAASAVQSAVDALEPSPPLPPAEPPPPELPAVVADIPAEPPAETASAPAFAWPASTRVSYVLTGNYRGEIHGSAQVEWVRVGTRYQVHLDVTVGLPFAPLLTRRMSSDGRLTEEGLAPERYDEDSKLAFHDRRRVTLRFEPDAVVLPDGRRRATRPGVQDAASQFAQLTYRFTAQPELLTPGATVEVPLALPRNVSRWVYDVMPPEMVYTPFGAVQAFPLKPRRVARPGGDMTAEIWFAPTLAYLPVRIRIHQDPQTFIDLVIERKPQVGG
ncbi:DUF3108 domain-containing protein [Piscinibacter sp.]|uniref:DUF3108 domain-containing protein n=1 Tax=Piscinibacter sp. TaxID=1903157 RepID=UPI002D051433|nr:DUF3108 domain-containing protein [Albitalea sp.]HUG23798.1 DUF3108 domain-containing protein [Albitalea sp.]